MLLTPEFLRSKRPCGLQFEKFFRLFPNGVEVTPDNAESVADQFDWWWAAEYLLGGKFYNEFVKQYRINTEPINAKIADLYQATNFDTINDDEYQGYRAKLREAYNKSQKIKARTFAQLWNEKYSA